MPSMISLAPTSRRFKEAEYEKEIDYQSVGIASGRFKPLCLYLSRLLLSLDLLPADQCQDGSHGRSRSFDRLRCGCVLHEPGESCLAQIQPLSSRCFGDSLQP